MIQHCISRNDICIGLGGLTSIFKVPALYFLGGRRYHALHAHSLSINPIALMIETFFRMQCTGLARASLQKCFHTIVGPKVSRRSVCFGQVWKVPGQRCGSNTALNTSMSYRSFAGASTLFGVGHFQFKGSSSCAPSETCSIMIQMSVGAGEMTMGE